MYVLHVHFTLLLASVADTTQQSICVSYISLTVRWGRREPKVTEHDMGQNANDNKRFGIIVTTFHVDMMAAKRRGSLTQWHELKE